MSTFVHLFGSRTPLFKYAMRNWPLEQKSRARNSGPTTLISLKIELIRLIKEINIAFKYDYDF